MDFSKYLGTTGLTELWDLMTSYVDGKIWIGTQDNYNNQSDSIKNGTIVIIIDEEEEDNPPPSVGPDTEDPEDNPSNNDPLPTTAKLGSAVLGAMVLGQEE